MDRTVRAGIARVVLGLSKPTCCLAQRHPVVEPHDLGRLRGEESLDVPVFFEISTLLT